MSWTGLGAACVVQLASSTLLPTETGWIEELELVVAADGGRCPVVELPLSPGVHLREHRAVARLGDHARVKLGAERWALPTRSPGDVGVARLHVPELVSGDRVEIEAVLEHDGLRTLEWEPAGARFAEVVAGRGVSVAPRGRATADGRGWWVGAATSADGASLTTSTHQGGPVAPGAPDHPGLDPLREPEEVRRAISLFIPAGNPQVSLYPGGGAAHRVEDRLTFAPAAAPGAWLVPLPATRSGFSAVVEPRGGGEVTEREDAALITLAPAESDVVVGLRWDAPDAPTFGERTADLTELEVRGDGALVVWDGPFWWLAGAHDQAVLPSREALIKGLDNRFRHVSLPEPGLPLSLRGRKPGWDLAGELRAALHAQVVLATWDHDPLWPRKLVKARRSGAMTPTEAALTLMLYARWFGLGSDWVLVRPAPLGDGARISLAGYDAPLVRLSHEGEVRWIDPACTACGPFEIRPELEGASAIGRGIDASPPPSQGRLAVEVDADEVRVRLAGPAALRLRQWIARIPEADQREALAVLLGGEGAKLTNAVGIDVLGGPIEITVATRTLQADPVALEGSWLDWVGTREVRWIGRAGTPTELTSGPLTYRRVVDDRGIVETVEVTSRAVDPADLVALAAARVEPEGGTPRE